MDSPLMLAVGVAVVGLVFKIIWNFLNEGKTKQGVYLTVEAFERHQKDCCVHALKRDFNECHTISAAYQATIGTKINAIETRMVDGHKEFVELHKELNQINKAISRIAAVVEFALEQKTVTK